MSKIFNTTGVCLPEKHYMVDLTSRLEKIKKLVDNGDYFVINRARQYGKTTILRALAQFLQEQYLVVSLDFQMLSFASFQTETSFVKAFARELDVALESCGLSTDSLKKDLSRFIEHRDMHLEIGDLFYALSDWCKHSAKPVVLIIDEVDSASNNQVFLDFLAQLRAYYLVRDRRATFRSVILAGVYDIKNVKLKIRPDDEHKVNSPWNIAADFNVDMSFSPADISTMLLEYEADHHTGMDVKEIAKLIYDYTSGYPFLVSRLCKLLDEVVAKHHKRSVWNAIGITESAKLLVTESNTLFESLMGKVVNDEELSGLLESVLFEGKKMAYNADNHVISLLMMYGFIHNDGGFIAIANRVFEMRLYNYFLSTAAVQNTGIYEAGLQDKNQFIEGGRLNMKLILTKFVEHFSDLYGDREDSFIEEEGRKYFLLYLRPIINGTGNYYIEARTRSLRRTDVIVDYRGEQFIIELKIWRGHEYNSRGEKQLADYLDYYHQKVGYMISFAFNKNKKSGVYEVKLDDKIIIEAIV